MTTSCRDCDSIPKHPDAGKVLEFQGRKIQVMHEGTKVLAGGYYGGWMQEIIEKLQGHHEPQEELAFHHLLGRVPSGALMVELGVFWAYYSNWFLGRVPGSRAICIEPDENNLAVGRTNAELNARRPEFHVGCIGGWHLPEVEFRRETDGKEVCIPCFNWESVVGLANQAFVDLLHIDAQGAELPFLGSLPETGCDKVLRFIMISTHHASISGSATTHRDCLLELVRRGAVVLCEHGVEESFSGDGLIVASFSPQDASSPLPQITRNLPELSLFSKDPAPQPVVERPNLSAGQIPLSSLRAEEPVLATTDLGPMWVMPSDSAIGASLLATGRFEEKMIEEVVGFLSARQKFQPEQFVDVGANIGSHLLYSMRSGLFKTGVAFEADPVNYDLLLRNIRLAGLENQVKAFHFPISDRAGAVTIERAPENLGDHRVRVTSSSSAELFQESHRDTLSLVSETLDNLDAEFQLGVGAGTLCWIDTQGHEGHVLAGAKGLLERGTLQYVVCEFWPYGLERSGGKEKFFDFLSRCCAIYDLRQSDWQNVGSLRCVILVQKYEELLRGGVGHTDLLCII
jgi:FkbM family methyltransferase